MDITENMLIRKKAAELALFPSEDIKPVMRVSKEGALLYANRIAMNLLQEKYGTIPGNILDFFPKENTHDTPAVFETVIQNKIFIFYTVPIAQQPYFNLYGTEITEQRKLEDTLKRRSATIITDSNDAIIVYNLKGNILAWNPGAEKMYGRSESEALQMNIARFVPADYAAENDTIFKKILSGEDVKMIQTKRMTKTGRIFDILLTATKLIDSEDKVYAIVTTEKVVSEN